MQGKRLLKKKKKETLSRVPDIKKSIAGGTRELSHWNKTSRGILGSLSNESREGKGDPGRSGFGGERGGGGKGPRTTRRHR